MFPWKLKENYCEYCEVPHSLIKDLTKLRRKQIILTKEGESSFFPKSMSPQDVVDSINEAYDSRRFIWGNTYEGETLLGMRISIRLDKAGKIISAGYLLRFFANTMDHPCLAIYCASCRGPIHLCPSWVLRPWL